MGLADHVPVLLRHKSFTVIPGRRGKREPGIHIQDFAWNVARSTISPANCRLWI